MRGEVVGAGRILHRGFLGVAEVAEHFDTRGTEAKTLMRAGWKLASAAYTHAITVSREGREGLRSTEDVRVGLANGLANGVGLALGAELNGNDYAVPAGRGAWIAKRKAEAERTGDNNMSQMHFARKGVITEEMLYIAKKEKISAELVRSAKWRAAR